jgi:hypothetical protein
MADAIDKLKEAVAAELQVRAAEMPANAVSDKDLALLLAEGYVDGGDLDESDVPQAINQLKAVFEKIGWPATSDELSDKVERWMTGDGLGLSEEEVEGIVELSSSGQLKRQADTTVDEAHEAAEAWRRVDEFVRDQLDELAGAHGPMDIEATHSALMDACDKLTAYFK